MSIKSRKFLLFFGDIFLLYLSLFLALYFRFWRNFNLEIFFHHLLPFTILYFFWLIVFYAFGLYDLEILRNPLSFYARAVSAVFLSLGLGMIFFYLIPFFGIAPKTNLVLNIIIFGILFLVSRYFFYSLFSAHFLSRIVIVGEGPEVENLKKEMEERPYLGYKLIEINLKEDLLSQIEKERIETVIFTEEFESDPKMLDALYFCLPTGVNFLDFATAYEMITEKIPISMISRAWFLENLKEGKKEIYEKTKRSIDVILASLLLLFTLLLWPFIALAIKFEDGGPVFYSQKRVGKNKKIFSLIKFRSMVPEAEKRGPRWAEREDERITKVGGFLRRTHLDEIPQMINVLKGEISLVGPRPERPEFVEKLEKEIPHYHLRHIIKPGFTGWAQIKFLYARSVGDSFKKFQYDLYYLKNRSLFLDIRILLKTFNLFFKKSS
jgi:exopolysaccharide biosynthesis polyprenyl glycosylphosphotransferase